MVYHIPSSWLPAKEGPHPTNNRFYLCEFRNVFFNHHRVLICYSLLRVSKCSEFKGAVVSIEFRLKINGVRRTVPSSSCLKTPKFMIYLSANRQSTVVLRLLSTTVIAKETVFSIEKGVYTQCTSLRMWTFCVQKKGNL